jgi:hypothetical protein
MLVTIGIWQVLLLVGIPMVAIWTENTEKRVSRGKFMFWMIAVLLFALLSDLALQFSSRSSDAIWISLIAIVRGDGSREKSHIHFLDTFRKSCASFLFDVQR